MYRRTPEENALWEVAEPYLEGSHLVADAPAEAIAAAERIREINADDGMQY